MIPVVAGTRSLGVSGSCGPCQGPMPSHSRSTTPVMVFGAFCTSLNLITTVGPASSAQTPFATYIPTFRSLIPLLISF